MSFKITTEKIEFLVARYFGYRTNIIVPNISWGLWMHECDLLIMSKSGYLTEIEIKISFGDLKKDNEKIHGHRSERIKYLYFAIPSYLCKHIEYIPKRAGVLVITSQEKIFCISNPVKNNANPLNAEDMFQVARLGAMRIWGLKGNILNLKNKIKSEMTA